MDTRTNAFAFCCDCIFRDYCGSLPVFDGLLGRVGISIEVVEPIEHGTNHSAKVDDYSPGHATQDYLGWQLDQDEGELHHLDYRDGLFNGPQRVDYGLVRHRGYEVVGIHDDVHNGVEKGAEIGGGT